MSGSVAIIVAGIAAVGSITVGFLTARVNHTKTLIDGLAREVERLTGRVEALEDSRQRDARYIDILVQHISDGKPPPPPPRPE